MPTMEINVSIAIQIVTGIVTIAIAFAVIRQKVHNLETSVMELETGLEKKLDTIFKRTDENRTNIAHNEKAIMMLPTIQQLEDKFVLKIELAHLSSDLVKTEKVLKEQMDKTESKIDGLHQKIDKLIGKTVNGCI